MLHFTVQYYYTKKEVRVNIGQKLIFVGKIGLKSGKKEENYLRL
jgi:hypothetical protein